MRTKNYYFTLIAALLLGSAFIQQAQALSLHVSDDADINQKNPSENSGVKKTLNIRNEGSSRESYARFDLTALPKDAEITLAMLRLYVNEVDVAGTLAVHEVAGDWSEGTLTSANAPFASAAFASVPIAKTAKNHYVMVDVTQVVKGWQSGLPNNGLALRPDASTQLKLEIDSKENEYTSHPMEIEVAFEGPLGPKGDKGDTGAQGLKGDQGNRGAAGPAGVTGPAGLAGADGLAGAQGLPGATGPIGLTGATGPADAPAPVHVIGDVYGGGIVFDVDDEGQHGLIAATADLSTGIQWFNGSNTVTNAVRDGVNAGLYNTDRIIIKHGAGSYAAQLCANYQGGGYSDWYLPSKAELNLLFQQRAVVGGFTSGPYWSSTEAGANVASLQVFNNGFQSILNKSSPLRVRAVRAF